jgi:hypothetical protein
LELVYGEWDLRVYHPYNGEDINGGKGISYPNTGYYDIPLEDGKNMFTNKTGTRFTITEMEIWKVTEMEQ